MISVGELATLAMEIQIYNRAILPTSLRPEHSVSSTNLKTIKKTLQNFNAENTASDPGSANTNAAEAANAFLTQWTSTGKSKNSAPSSIITVDNREPELDSLTFSPEDPAEELEAEDQAEIAKMLDEWEGAEDRLERKKVRQP